MARKITCDHCGCDIENSEGFLVEMEPLSGITISTVHNPPPQKHFDLCEECALVLNHFLNGSEITERT